MFKPAGWKKIGALAAGMVFFLLTSAGSAALLQAPESGAYEPFAVIELYTSEGCSSCPPADQLLIELTEMAREQNLRIYTLGFHVDYWNGLGWKDRFSDTAYAQRQREYAKVLDVNNIYTPQMIINGETQFSGYRHDLARQTIDQVLAVPARAGIALRVRPGKDREQEILTLTFNLRDVLAGDYLYLALVERNLSNQVKKGENAGKRLSHDNVVRIFQSYPAQEGLGELIWPLPPDVDKKNLSVIAFLQNPRTMAIAAAAGADVIPPKTPPDRRNP